MRLYLEPKSDGLHQIAVGLKEGLHDVDVYRRSDAVNGQFRFKGFALDAGASLDWPARRPKRRIEFFGDSVTSAARVEAVGYEGMPDVSVGTYDRREPLANAYWSYAWIAARALGAEAHVNGIGGLALNDGNGWWGGKQLTGLESTFDKLSPLPARFSPWDFSKWTPHVVVIAICQNDKRYMNPRDPGDRRKWAETYRRILNQLRSHYPHAWTILTTTILDHDEAWDSLVDEVAADYRRECGDKRMVGFHYRRAGRGTPGHLRLAEHQEMADELASFIRSLPRVWSNQP
jgi:hypothetical protein